jgi:DNA polymerase-1
VNILGVDWETSKFPVMHPWQAKAFPVLFGIVDLNRLYRQFVFNHDEDPAPTPHPVLVKKIQAEIDKADLLVAHNMKFDHNWMLKVGLDTSRVKLYCTQVAEYIIRGQAQQSYTLEDVSNFYGIPPKIDKVKVYWNAGYETSEVPLPLLTEYLEQDCLNPLALYQRQQVLIKEKGLEKLILLEMEKMRVLSHIEMNGMRTDRGKAEKFGAMYQEKVKQLDGEITKLVGREINLDSDYDMSAVMYGGIVKREGVEEYEVTLKSGVVKRKTRKKVYDIPVRGLGFKPPQGSELAAEGVFSTSKDTLAQLKPRNKQQEAMLKFLKDRSNAQKALETFVGKKVGSGLIAKIQEDGNIHPTFNQTVARTGRFTSSDPNGQNLPRKGTSPVKQIFYPKFDLIGNGDLSQLEWRVAAYLSQDPVALKEIYDNVDYHLDNALKFFGDKKYRTTAKVFGFRLLYGGSAYGMFMDATMPRFDLKRWEQIVADYYQKYRGIAEWQNGNIDKVNKNKGWLKSPSGRILTFVKEGGIYSPTKIKNYPVQSFATADIMPLAMVMIFKRMRERELKSQIICQVHDSLVYDLIETEAEEIADLTISTFKELPSLMKRTWGINFNVPLTGDFEVGPNYGKLDKFC